mmetsp:Transcript_18387/g.45382  ORF Transcript_18387/g.45382 Transcript_18387/m.45382 type:complete len:90 (-) Transcript_18387:45-314(-)
MLKLGLVPDKESAVARLRSVASEHLSMAQKVALEEANYEQVKLPKDDLRILSAFGGMINWLPLDSVTGASDQTLLRAAPRSNRCGCSTS